MKKFNLLVAVAISCSLFSCGNGEKGSDADSIAEAAEAVETVAQDALQAADAIPEGSIETATGETVKIEDVDASQAQSLLTKYQGIVEEYTKVASNAKSSNIAQVANQLTGLATQATNTQNSLNAIKESLSSEQVTKLAETTAKFTSASSKVSSLLKTVSGSSVKEAASNAASQAVESAKTKAAETAANKASEAVSNILK